VRSLLTQRTGRVGDQPVPMPHFWVVLRSTTGARWRGG